MRETTKNKQTGISWTMSEMLEDLDFADDIALLSHRHRDMQEKTNQLVTSAAKIGLKINVAKTKIMKINTRADEPITLDGISIEEVNNFVYLGSKITTDGDSEVDVQARISKVTGAYAALRNIWWSSKIRNHTKVRIFISNVLGVLLYGALP